MIKDRKGFTMVELLATIVILGILVVVAVGGVTKILEKAKVEYYKTTEKDFKLAAQSYVQNNRNYLPKKVGKMTKISLRTLKEQKYLDTIKDYSKKSCDLDNSYVQIFKYSKTDYSYLSYLKCPNYESNKVINTIKPEITIDFHKTSSKDDSSLKTAEATITITGSSKESTEPNVKLLGYNYIVYKDGKEVISSGSVQTNYAKEVVKKINLVKYTPGKITIKVSATNIYGLTASKTKSTNYKDVEPPICGAITGDSTTWTNKNRKITVKCSDGNGSGCTRPEFTKTFKNDIKTSTITIEDEAGNETACKVNVYLDKTKPQCTVGATGTSGNNGWFKTNNITMSLTKSDNLSDIAGYDLTTSETATYNGATSKIQGDTTGTTWYGHVKDKAGNVNTCTKYVKVDTKNPTCSITKNGTLGTNSWYKEKNVGLTLNRNDTGGSTIDTFGLTTSSSVTYNNSASNSQGDTNGVTWYGYVRDMAGNTVSCNSGSFKVDTVKPTCSIGATGTGGNNGWYRGTVSLSLTRNDTRSGVSSYGLSTSGNPTYNGKVSASQSNTGGTTWYGYVQDRAGNINSCAKSVKVDVTPPTCSSSGGNTSWTNGSRTLTGTCSDSISGCTKSTITRVISSQTNSAQSPGTVYDNAGNSASCPANQTVRIDTTAPSCTSSGGSTSWTNGSRTLKGTCGDSGGSGCRTATISTTIDYQVNSTTMSPGTVYDNAGNSKACPGNQTVRIDKTPPTIQYGWCSGCNSESINYGSAVGQYVFYYYDTGGSGLSTTWYAAVTGGGCNSGWKAAGNSLCSGNQMKAPYRRAYKVKDNAGNYSNVICSWTDNTGIWKYGPGSSCTAYDYTFYR